MVTYLLLLGGCLTLSGFHKYLLSIVFDFCLTKSMYTDTASNVTTLQLCWASRNNCIQRSGRAGRVMDGRVYRLVPQKFFDELMDQTARPEMLCCPLERVVLKAKILDMGAPQSILALAMDPPDLSDIQNTVLGLKELGALLRTTVGTASPEHDGELTYLGRVAAALPLDIRVTRLIVFGHCFSVLEECIIIGAGLNVKSIFNSPFSKALQAYSKKMRWSDGSGSDLFAILKAYRVSLGMYLNNFDCFFIFFFCFSAGWLNIIRVTSTMPTPNACGLLVISCRSSL